MLRKLNLGNGKINLTQKKLHLNINEMKTQPKRIKIK